MILGRRILTPRIEIIRYSDLLFCGCLPADVALLQQVLFVLFSRIMVAISQRASLLLPLLILLLPFLTFPRDTLSCTGSSVVVLDAMTQRKGPGESESIF